MLFAALQRFYEGAPGALKLVKNPQISLRVLDWLCTNYSKSVRVQYTVDGAPFDLHASYRDWLRAFSKKNMDPFARGPRIDFMGADTTMGQLNFFRWASLHNVVAFARANLLRIEQHMLSNAPRTLKHSEKRREITKAVDCPCAVFNVTVRINIPTIPTRNPWTLPPPEKQASRKHCKVEHCDAPRSKRPRFTLDKFVTDVEPIGRACPEPRVDLC